jgi:phenylacetate-CoA ligase
MNKLVEKIYHSSPVYVQNIAISAYGLHWFGRRYRGVFNLELKKCLQRNNFTEPLWYQFQNESLQKIMVHSFDTVPYYQEVFNNKGLTREYLSRITLPKLKELPLLEKETFRRLGTSDLLSKRRNLRVCTIQAVEAQELQRKSCIHSECIRLIMQSLRLAFCIGLALIIRLPAV